jgi:hypothetical protein
MRTFPKNVQSQPDIQLLVLHYSAKDDVTLDVFMLCSMLGLDAAQVWKNVSPVTMLQEFPAL